MNLRQHPSMPHVFVSDEGRVFVEPAQTLDSAGYRNIRIGKMTIRRHTLVCETFVGPRPPGQGVRHLDGDPSNDSPSNLAWGTQAENCADTVAHGRSTRGGKNYHAKLTESQVREIKARLASGEGPTSLASDFGVSQPTISGIKAGTVWGWLA